MFCSAGDEPAVVKLLHSFWRFTSEAGTPEGKKVCYYSIVKKFVEVFSLITDFRLGFLIQPQAIDSYLTGDSCFFPRLEIFRSIMQDYQQIFGVCGTDWRDQGFFVFGKLLNFSYRLLRKIFAKLRLPAIKDWDLIHCFDFTGPSFLSIGDFTKKCLFRTATLRVLELSMDVETERSRKKYSTQIVTTSLVKKTLTLYLESTRIHKKFVSDGPNVHSLWILDVVKNLASFDYSVLFLLPK